MYVYRCFFSFICTLRSESYCCLLSIFSPPEESTEESSANRIEQSQSEQQASPQLEQQVSAQSVVEKLLVKRLWVENALPEIVSSSIAQLEQ